MLKEQSFYGLENWKCYYGELVTPALKDDFKRRQIIQENERDYIVFFVEQKSEKPNHLKIECYKKHATSILKSILIGKFSLLVFNGFKNEINQIQDQSILLERAINKPEFAKYSLQKKLYFNID